MLSHKALNWKLSELWKQKWRDREDLASKSEKREKELGAAKGITARLERVLREYGTSQGMKRGRAERVSSSGSEGNSKSNDSPEKKSPSRKMRKEK